MTIYTAGKYDDADLEYENNPSPQGGVHAGAYQNTKTELDSYSVSGERFFGYISGDNLKVGFVCPGDTTDLEIIIDGNSTVIDTELLPEFSEWDSGNVGAGLHTLIIQCSDVANYIALDYIEISGDAYEMPVYNRTLANPSYFNVIDRIRIYNNAQVVNGLFTSAIGYTIPFDAVATPTTATVPTKTTLNTLLANIERMRAWGPAHLVPTGYITDPLFVEIKDDWGEGHAVSAPNYTHVNSWEKVLDILYNALTGFTPPVITGDLLLLTDAISLSNTDLIG